MTPQRPQLGGGDGAVFEVRNYGALLELSEELQTYNRYLDTKGMQEKNNAIMRFDSARRKFVYELCQDRPDDAEQVLPAIWADMDRILAEGHYGDETIAHVRRELTRHIRKQAVNNPFQRFVTRWGPPALMTIFFIAALYFLYLRFSGGLS